MVRVVAEMRDFGDAPLRRPEFRVADRGSGEIAAHLTLKPPPIAGQLGSDTVSIRELRERIVSLIPSDRVVRRSLALGASAHPWGQYLLRRPGGTSRPMPLVLGLHGGGPLGPEGEGLEGRPDSLMQALVEALGGEEVVLCTPQALCANWCCSRNQALLRAVISDLLRQVPIDPCRVLVIGYSMGGPGAALLASDAGATEVPIAGVGILSTAPLPFAALDSTVPAFFACDVGDEVCSPQTTLQAAECRRAAHAPVEVVVTSGARHDLSPLVMDRAARFLLQQRASRGSNGASSRDTLDLPELATERAIWSFLLTAASADPSTSRTMLLAHGAAACAASETAARWLRGAYSDGLIKLVLAETTDEETRFHTLRALRSASGRLRARVAESAAALALRKPSLARAPVAALSTTFASEWPHAGTEAVLVADAWLSWLERRVVDDMAWPCDFFAVADVLAALGVRYRAPTADGAELAMWTGAVCRRFLDARWRPALNPVDVGEADARRRSLAFTLTQLAERMPFGDPTRVEVERVASGTLKRRR